MRKKLLSVLCAATMLFANTTVISTNADYTPSNVAFVSGDVDVQTVGLIYDYNLSVSNKNGQLCINGITRAMTEMKSVGFTDIKVEQSSNGTSGWTALKDPKINDILASGTTNCYITNYTVSVTKGYYYRVTCNHYAKESGLFGSSQSVSNTSNSVKIS